ncbi:3-methyladenine DNA glycosylase [Haloferula chungangensis]|uniref:3-methyladenine DNA glycosylase n=1 Tax=Haloferula chungangensis TaxID=1048331 RepID=A0ABW2L3J5_9BACT
MSLISRNAEVTTTLQQSEWQRLAAEHRRRAERWTVPARQRHTHGVPHPIEDFLFTYYSFTLGKLETWHPPFGCSLEASDKMAPQFERAPYRRDGQQIFADPSALSEKAVARLVWIRELLVQTQNRTPNFSCHGIHEWAMVYRGHEIRHEASTPLRLRQSEIDAIVESRPIACSHFDAFRHFSPDARAFNRFQPSLDARPHLEQPGCVHANMDLYKWASKCMPWIGSELHIECFELAIRLRELDMRASPYDLTAYGHRPIAIETAEGRREYEALQKQLASEARPLREKLIGHLDPLLSIVQRSPGSCHAAAGALRPGA